MKFLTKFIKPALMFLWNSFGKPAIDNPKTKEDESDVFDPAVEAAIDELVKLAEREAKKKGAPIAPMDLAKDVVKKFPQVSLRDALKKVDSALGRK